MAVGRQQPEQAQEDQQRPEENGERGQPQGDAPLVEPLGQRTDRYEREHRGQKQPEGQQPDLVRGEAPEVGVHVEPHHVVEAASAGGEHRADDQHAVRAVGARGAQFAGETLPAERAARGCRPCASPGGVQTGDQPVRAERTDQNRRGDHGRAHQSEPRVRGRVEASVEKRRGRREEIEIAQHRRGQAAQPAEQQAVAHECGPLVVRGREFGQHRPARHRIERHRHPDPDGEGAQPEKETGLPELGRTEQEQQADRHRQRRCVHERMSAAPARAEVVGHRTDERIGHRVDAQRDEDRDAAQRPGQAEHLVVIEQQKDVEDGILRALGYRADAVEQSGRQADAAGRGRGWGLHEGRERCPRACRPTLRPRPGGDRAAD